MQKNWERVLTYLEHCKTSGAGDGVSTVGVEVQRLSQRLGDSRRGYDGGERESIANSFGHGHNVWHHAVRFKAPECLPRPAETGLHLGTEDKQSNNKFISIWSEFGFFTSSETQRPPLARTISNAFWM